MIPKFDNGKDIIMWLEIFRERRAELGYSYKYIAEESKTAERTVIRIFSNETKYPSIDTIYRIASVLNLSLDELFADSKSVIGNKHYADLQEENINLTNEVERLNAELVLVRAENSVNKDKVGTLTTENDILRLKLEHKEEIIALHNYYINRKPNE